MLIVEVRVKFLLSDNFIPGRNCIVPVLVVLLYKKVLFFVGDSVAGSVPVASIFNFALQ